MSALPHGAEILRLPDLIIRGAEATLDLGESSKAADTALKALLGEETDKAVTLSSVEVKSVLWLFATLSAKALAAHEAVETIAQAYCDGVR